MKWSIKPQILTDKDGNRRKDKDGKVMEPVMVRGIYFQELDEFDEPAVDEDGNKIRAKLIKKKVMIQSDKGQELSLERVRRSGKFQIYHPSVVTPRTIKIGMGKNARYIPDLLNPPLEKPGMCEKFDLDREFVERVSKFVMNDELVKEIVGLLTQS